jgi:hypothetical protein
MRHLFTILASALLLNACAAGRTSMKPGSTPEGEVVQAEGRCPIAGDLASAKSCSLAAAQRAAVEKVVGVFVSARTRVDKAVAIEQNILSRSEGYVRRYEIVSEGRTKDNFHSTTIRALIPPQEIGADVDRLIRSSVVGNPRVAVMIDELADGEVTDRLRATQVLTEALINKGFKVVDREALAQANAMAQIKAIEAGDAARINQLARALNAEILVVGTAHSGFNTDRNLGGLVSYRSNISLQAVKSGSGEIIRSVAKTASGVEMNRELAADKARENAAAMAAEVLVDELPKALHKKAGVLVEVRGLSTLSQVEDVRQALQTAPGVKDIYTRSYQESNAMFELSTGDGAEPAALALALEKVRTVPIKVTNVTHDEVRAEVTGR